MYRRVTTLISPYIEKDPTAFCSYEAFQRGQSILEKFCLLRAESITKQLAKTIAPTVDGQKASNNAGFVDASSLDIDKMGNSFVSFNPMGGR